jgi:hypothetical protein
MFGIDAERVPSQSPDPSPRARNTVARRNTGPESLQTQCPEEMKKKKRI